MFLTQTLSSLICVVIVTLKPSTTGATLVQYFYALLQSDFESDDMLDGYSVEDGLSQLLRNNPEKKPWALSDILQDRNELDHFKVSLYLIVKNSGCQ